MNAHRTVVAFLRRDLCALRIYHIESVMKDELEGISVTASGVMGGKDETAAGQWWRMKDAM